MPYSSVRIIIKTLIACMVLHAGCNQPGINDFKDVAQIVEHGRILPGPGKIKLAAGPLSLTYEKGDIRHVKFGDREILRMIFMAVRTVEWYTLDCEIKGEKIIKGEKEFTIEYDRIYSSGDIQFTFSCSIIGKEDGTIIYSVDGVSQSAFETNRIGLNVLHPVKECAGKPCIYTNKANRVVESQFPVFIAPHSPFTDIVSMKWPVKGSCYGLLRFEGELFETEDHRNWTDASYKTYCRPLGLPKPFTVSEGERVVQSVTFSLSEDPGNPPETDPAIRFEITGNSVDLPKIGVGRPERYQPASSRDNELIRQIGFSHYSCELKLYESDWPLSWSSIIDESEKLGLPLELTLIFSDNYIAETERFIGELKDSKPRINCINIFSSNRNITEVDLIRVTRSRIKDFLPGVKTGGGAKGLFVDLNRNRPDPERFDFFVFSSHPQQHAFDNTTLVENMEGAAYPVSSAKQFGNNIPIHVSPVTLTKGLRQIVLDHDPVKLLPDIDARQLSLFGAGWTLGSIKYLAESGADVLTFYETTGLNGIIQGGSRGILPGDIRVPSGMIFPLYYIFYELLEWPGSRVIISSSSHPLEVDGMVIESGRKRKIILSNFTEIKQKVSVGPVTGRAQVRMLDSGSAGRAIRDFDEFYRLPVINPVIEDNYLSLELKPFATAIINAH